MAVPRIADFSSKWIVSGRLTIRPAIESFADASERHDRAGLATSVYSDKSITFRFPQKNPPLRVVPRLLLFHSTSSPPLLSCGAADVTLWIGFEGLGFREQPYTAHAEKAQTGWLRWKSHTRTGRERCLRRKPKAQIDPDAAMVELESDWLCELD